MSTIPEELRRTAFENHDSCINCGYGFKKGDTALLGYGIDGKPLYVCEKCSGVLKMISERYSFEPRCYEVPPDESRLWRYMDFTKYVSMLSEKGLFFVRSDCFQDSFEGAKGLHKRKEKWDNFYRNFLVEVIKNPPEGYENTYSEQETNEQAERLLNHLDSLGKKARKRTFINCWHENEHESEAMWRLYSTFIDNAIAVRTTYKSLYYALGRNPSINIGRIKYINFQKSFAGVNDCFWRKSISFEHEREVRAIAIDNQCRTKGKLIKCDIQRLIEEIFVSPKAPYWFRRLIYDVNEKYGIKVKICHSELLEKLFY